MKHGSFSQTVKEEITSFEYTNEQYLALLSGFIKTNGVVSISSKKMTLSLQTENSKIAKLIYKAISYVFNATPQFSYSKKMKLDKCVIYHVNINDKVEEILKELNLNESIVIYLSLDKTTAEKRVLGRMVCPNCKSVYNKYFIETSPKLAGVCDKCNTKLEKRVDDNIETFDKRYDTYCKETKPLVDFYKSKNILYEIDSSLSKEIVFDKIKKVLEGLE